MPPIYKSGVLRHRNTNTILGDRTNRFPNAAFSHLFVADLDQILSINRANSSADLLEISFGYQFVFTLLGHKY